MTLTLYHHGSSVCAAKVRMQLAEKGLDWEGVYIDILKGEQFTPEFMKINPKAVVPSLIHEGRIINESTVICEYLDKVWPETSLHPADPYEYTKVRYWSKALDEALHPACGELTFAASHRHTVAKLGKEGLEKFLNSTPPISVTAGWHERKKELVRNGFGAPGAAEKVKLYDMYLHKMEEALTAGDWLVGDTFTHADVGLTPYVNRLAMMSMSGMWENGRLPRVAAWWNRIQARPSFKPMLLDWVPEDLTNDLRENGAKSWPEVAAILNINI
jgi:glutathione S-transferase